MNDSDWRLLIFIATLTLMVALEHVIPANANRTKTAKSWRWVNHFGLVFVGTVLTRLVLPTGLTAIAIFAAQNQWGLLHWTSTPATIGLVIGVIVLDFVIYWQHRLFHLVPALWRLHRVHHVDPNVDVSSALRFHPVEILLSLGIKASAIIAFGIGAQAVLLFEVLLSSLALFNHSNIHIKQRIEGRLRRFLITPSLHRIHHSVVKRESHCNFGFSVPLWDKLFNSYLGHSSQNEQPFKMGVDGFSGEKESLWQLLKQPFSRGLSGRAKQPDKA